MKEGPFEISKGPSEFKFHVQILITLILMNLKLHL
jgi:hypothetical protein